MPLTRIALPHGKSAAFKQTLMDQVYAAMRQTFDVPEDDRFMVIGEHGASTCSFGRSYLGIDRSDDLIIIQITASEGRSVATKKALYRAIVDRLAEAPGVRREDVFINLVEVRRENWSFGLGEAQYAQ